ncbi:MAG: SDR family NAD(P)-dependent oxidoreductase [Candidatus Kariarchaeaceae archaeon]|jgi:3-oxoacyl-[acyl-carrier protein] reductase
MELGLQGKTILITGASGGIGYVTAQQLAIEGANLILQYFSNETSIKQLSEELLKSDIEFLCCKVDLSNEEEIRHMFRQAREKFGRIDGLVNNAGIWPPQDSPIHEMETSRWDNTLSVNLRSIFLCSKYFMQNLVEYPSDYASIVLIGSTAGVVGEAFHIDYSASKAALHGFMLSLKNEIVHISKFGRVNTISPGWTITPMAREGLKDTKAVTKVLRTMALRKIGKAKDIANSIVFLLSDQVSGHISGQNIVIAGGMEGRLLHSTDDIDPQKAVQ